MIAEDGLEKVTMRALSQRLEVSRTAAYRHFANKNALLCAIAEEGYQTLTNRFQSISSDTSLDAPTKFQKIGLAYIHFAMENPGYFRLMFGHEIIQQERSPELLAAAAKAFNELLTAIETCQNEDIIRQGESLPLANAAWVIVHGLASLLVDGQILKTDEIPGLPALITDNQLHPLDNIDQFALYSLMIFFDGIKVRK